MLQLSLLFVMSFWVTESYILKKSNTFLNMKVKDHHRKALFALSQLSTANLQLKRQRVITVRWDSWQWSVTTRKGCTQMLQLCPLRSMMNNVSFPCISTIYMEMTINLKKTFKDNFKKNYISVSRYVVLFSKSFMSLGGTTRQIKLYWDINYCLN